MLPLDICLKGFGIVADFWAPAARPFGGESLNTVHQRTVPRAPVSFCQLWDWVLPRDLERRKRQEFRQNRRYKIHKTKGWDSLPRKQWESHSFDFKTRPAKTQWDRKHPTRNKPPWRKEWARLARSFFPSLIYRLRGKGEKNKTKLPPSACVGETSAQSD